MQVENIKRVSKALKESWSLASSSTSCTRWTATNPALGQCGVIALVAQDCLGGEIVKTWVVKPEDIKLWHFYNVIDNNSIDFIISQFDEPINYDHQPSTREQAFVDTDAEQYGYLSATVQKHLQSSG